MKLHATVITLLVSTHMGLHGMQHAVQKTYSQLPSWEVTHTFCKKYAKQTVDGVYNIPVTKRNVAIVTVAAACAVYLLNPYTRKTIKTFWRSLRDWIRSCLQHKNPHVDKNKKEQDAKKIADSGTTSENNQQAVPLKEPVNDHTNNNHAQTGPGATTKRETIDDDASDSDIVKDVDGDADEKIAAEQSNAAAIDTELETPIDAEEQLVLDNLAQLGEKVNEIHTKSKLTALMLCAKEGNLWGVKILLKNPHLDINQQDRFGKTALMHAVTNAAATAEKIVAVLLQHKDINPNIRNNDDNTALTLAIAAKQESMVKILLESDEVDLNQEQYGQTIAMHAVGHGHTLLASQVIPKVSHLINIGNNFNWTPLHKAASEGSANIVRLLLEHGADATIEDKSGKIPENIARAQKSEFESLQKPGHIAQTQKYDAVIKVFEEYKKNKNQ